MHFAQSKALTLGLELEFQIVDTQTGLLSPSSLAFRQALQGHALSKHFALEATLSTIELNSSVHDDVQELEQEIVLLTRTLREIAQPLGLDIRGGGTQLAQFWNERTMTPTDRATELEKKYGFLPKRFSTYGMHVHIGVPSADEAIMLTNGLQALVPLFIALSAASPYLQLSDTGFAASRPLESLVYPHGGGMPYLANWAEFEETIKEVFDAGLASSLKDVYWDVRPKPEFGTVEVRVFDTPLSVHKAVALAAFTRACAALLLHGDMKLTHAPAATAERVSRFMACRDGLDATVHNPYAQTKMPVRQWFDAMVADITRAPVSLKDLGYIQALQTHCAQTQDCDTMRRIRSATQHSVTPQNYMHGLAEYSQQVCEQLFRPI